MSKLGDRLRNQRQKLSLNKVAMDTGITNSRLSKMERGLLECPPEDLMTLADYYDVSLVQLFVDAGYLRESDIKKYQLVFKGAELLNEEDRQHIQMQVDYLNKKKEGRENV